ncbi:hypothetical protein Ahu01nite_038370 [Winogradskya humida]|uniref:Uncharacterized protein n=1 Tax=Winogradskya humida TaxID=113566 RepID=A0ABQ3ZQ73_9ACTN|nr:hypothetical protein Ahu01nite_038370 [Actinoplanes humidus]
MQIYHPIGFHASLGFLEELAGAFQRDEAALLRALEVLSASRAGWQAEIRRYSERRRVEKRLGRRAPRAGELNPNGRPPVWFGAELRAELYSLAYRRRETGRERAEVWSDPDVRELDAALAACLTAGSSGAAAEAAAGGAAVGGDEQRRALVDALERLQRRVGQDPDLAHFCRDLMWIARLVVQAPV